MYGGLSVIITQTPFRISFFGGGTDFSEYFRDNGGVVLSSAIDKYCYVHVRPLPPFFEFQTHLTYHEEEKVDSAEAVRHPLIRECMRRYGVNGLRLIYDADLPARSGLGTSSSFAVGMINAFCKMQGRPSTKKYLADEAIAVERDVLNETGGWQDQIAAAYGGFNKIVFSRDGYEVTNLNIDSERKKSLNDNLLMFFTGFTHDSAAVQRRTALNDNKAALSEMARLATCAENILKDKNKSLSEFGGLLGETWRLKRGLSSAVSTEKIDNIYEKAISAGATGGKILGAGGGGFLLLYVEKDAQSGVKNALSDLRHVGFGFEEEGSKVIYRNEAAHDIEQ
jgi:D-glycero-alpha-D-manno-heptose-7-phosphate kinase